MNNTNTIGSFLIKARETTYRQSPITNVTVEIDDEATLEEMLEAFKNFLSAMGYSIAPGEYLEFSKDDYYKVEASNEILINETKYKGEF